MLTGISGIKFSTRSRYAIIVLIDLALNGKGVTRSVNDISETWGISQKYISRLVIPLRNKGYISSSIGANGGYTLRADPGGIRILDIIDLMDGPFGLCRCIPESNEYAHAEEDKPYPIWMQINQKLRDALAAFTIAEMVAAYATPPSPILPSV